MHHGGAKICIFDLLKNTFYPAEVQQTPLAKVAILHQSILWTEGKPCFRHLQHLSDPNSHLDKSVTIISVFYVLSE